MIKKVYAFNALDETLLRRCYARTLSDAEIRKMVKGAGDCNFVHADACVTFKHVETYHIVIVADEENEMHVLALLNHFLMLLERTLGNTSEQSLVYNFKDAHALLDSFILNGKVIATEVAEVFAGGIVECAK